MNQEDFLFEIGCEELPPKALPRLCAGLKAQVINGLNEATINFHDIKSFATPRRLALLIKGLATAQPTQITVRQGPSADKAFDKHGTPTLACIGFARSCGVSTDQLKIRQTDKGERLYCEVEQKGHQTAALLPQLLSKALDNLPVNKPMRWGNNEKPFIRPVKWVVMMLGQSVIAAEFYGKHTGAKTYGHRFHHPQAIDITTPSDYATLLLEKGFVIADFDARKETIKKQLKNQCTHYGKPVIDDALLNEVTALVEYPNVLVGQFNQDFLEIPGEALTTAMKVHQKCFPITDDSNRLLPYFILVSNIKSKDPQKVIEGNERVINARLSDAAFFYHKDRGQPLSYYTDKLSCVVFQKTLGTLADRTTRLKSLCNAIALQLNKDPSQAEQAAALAKFDLMTDMVTEFPELQGIMGYYYALEAKEPKAIALAIKEHYYPRFSGDSLPTQPLSVILALADRIDHLVGILGINLIPTGEKDPYALKRAALAVVRLLVEKALPLDLINLLEQSHTNFNHLPNTEVITQAYHFIMERMRSWYLEQNFTPELFAAVTATNPSMPLDFDHRMKAVKKFLALPESRSLAAANKRVSNILKKSDYQKTLDVDDSLFENDTERKLATLLKAKMKAVNSLYTKAQYTEALTELAALKDPVDLFFDDVMIMVEDSKIRKNRLALLSQLHHLFTQVADISLLSS